MSGVRTIVLWFPDWPVTALLRARARELDARASQEGVAPDAPIALVHGNRVVACSAAARSQGVRAGQRRRDAQSACPSLVIAPADDGRDARAFHDALRVLEELSPGAQALRPGLAALRARGPARFYGGEEAAAASLLEPLRGSGFADVRAGIADGVFAAEQAARLAGGAGTGGRAAPGAEPGARTLVVAPGGSAPFLAPLPVSALGDADAGALLARLGVRTLGEFAALDARLVRDRMGTAGATLHARAAGADPREVSPRVPPPELAREIALEPPLEIAEQVAFAARRTVEEFHEALGAAGLACTAVRIVLVDDDGRRSERVWQHPVSFDAPATVDRIRWQLQEAAGEAAPGQVAMRGGVALVRIEPEAVDAANAHQPALIGHGPNERAHHAMTRAQAVLGHRGVLSPRVGGGRTAAEREVLLPWDDDAPPDATAGRPWPGALPAPLPAEVFREPIPVEVAGAGGAVCAVDERGALTAEPASLSGRPIVSWAGPWPLVERDWDAERARCLHRFQLVDGDGGAWLAVLSPAGWALEGRYA
ncbi:DNA polymerase Y family protein [Microbacterium halophytorum]|uniref:DNA polymerase Y family protein n=1 Tax=Microbacterium halophytorum TaxID=2067568 RepID=UPI000CFCC7AD|nr:DNA polymerase Y family protein [Microbacterium halophytorum]